MTSHVLERLLKATGLDTRITIGDRWMYWDEETNQWVVLTRKAYQHANTILYQGMYVDEAAAALTEGLMEEAL